MSHRSTPHYSKQSETILALLRAANGAWVELPEILKLGIAQYNARIFELRKAGHIIENRLEKIDGVPHSAFRLIDLPLFDSLERSA